MQIENCSQQQLEREKQKLRQQEPSVIISYIKASIEILNSLRADHSQSERSSQMKSSNRTIDNKLDESDINQDDANEYEKMIQKLESDVREHIKCQQQLKLHIESLQNKIDDMERTKSKQTNQADQIEKLKKENRRQDELITMKEDKVIKMEDIIEKLNRRVKKAEEDQAKTKQFDEQIKQIEKNHQKQVLQLLSEIQHLKKNQLSQQSAMSSAYPLSTSESNHNSNQDSMPTGSMTTATTCSSNQQIEKPQISSRGAGFHRNSQPNEYHNVQKIKDSNTVKEFENFMYSMDHRENINPNQISFGNGQGQSKSIDKTSNSKMIMAKQMMFETMGNNMPRQQNFFNNTKGDASHRVMNPLIERKNSVLGNTGPSQPQPSQVFIGDFQQQRSHRGNSNNDDLSRLKEKLSQINGSVELKNAQKITLKRKNSRNENKQSNGIDIDQLEAETARIHRELVTERTCYDQEKSREKRTVSDNTRGTVLDQSQVIMVQNNQNACKGIKVMLDKSQNMVNSQSGTFIVKRPSTHMLTERTGNTTSGNNYLATQPTELAQEIMGVQSSRRHYNNQQQIMNQSQGTTISNYKIIKKKPGSSVNGHSLNQTAMIQGRDSSANISVNNISQVNIQNSKIPQKMLQAVVKQQPLQNNESDVIRTVFAGMASICAASVTHPIDTIKVKLQVQGSQKHGQSLTQTPPSAGQMGNVTPQRTYNNMFQGMKLVVNEEGMRGLYRGITASWMRESIYSSLRLGLYEPFKRLLQKPGDDEKHMPFYKKFLAAGMSGFIGSALANPTDLLKVRMQAWEGSNHGIAWHAKDVYAHGGIAGFYKGLNATILRAVLLNATKLATYDHIKNFIIRNKFIDNIYIVHFVSSVIAGICIAVVTSPVDLVKTRIMNQGSKWKQNVTNK
eukprot:403365779